MVGCYHRGMSELPVKPFEGLYDNPKGPDVRHGEKLSRGFVPLVGTSHNYLPLPQMLADGQVKKTGPDKYESLKEIVLTEEDDGVNFCCGKGVVIISKSWLPNKPLQPCFIDYDNLRAKDVQREDNEPPAPVITSISPTSGLFTGGTPVTITGENFDTPSAGTTRVYFDGNEATNVVVVNDTTITCETPGGNPGTVAVVVQNDNGTSDPFGP